MLCTPVIGTSPLHIELVQFATPLVLTSIKRTINAQEIILILLCRSVMNDAALECIPDEPVLLVSRVLPFLREALTGNIPSEHGCPRPSREKGSTF